MAEAERIMLINRQRVLSERFIYLFFWGDWGAAASAYIRFPNKMKLRHTSQGVPQAWRPFQMLLMRFCCRSNWIQSHLCS